MRPTHLARMKHAGINAVVIDPRRLTLKELRATVKAAKGARLWVIELVPPAHAKATRSIKAVRATCRASRKPAQTLCAASTASLSAAIALSRSSGSTGRMVAVRLAGPAQVGRLRGVSSSGLQILALVKLRAHRYATSEWRKAIAVAATTSSLDLAVTPTSTSNQTLSPYLNQLGKPPSAPRFVRRHRLDRLDDLGCLDRGRRRNGVRRHRERHVRREDGNDFVHRRRPRLQHGLQARCH